MKSLTGKLAALMLLALLLAACGSPQAAEQPAEPAAAEQSDSSADAEMEEPADAGAADEEMEMEDSAEADEGMEMEASDSEAEPAAEEMVNAVVVEDQSLGDGNTVVIASVSSITPGWLVIHADSGSGPGPIIGHAAVNAGSNSNVSVKIDPSQATDTLFAMLHVDAGVEGEYEFPGDDVPATDADGNVVTPPFQLITAIEY